MKKHIAAGMCVLILGMWGASAVGEVSQERMVELIAAQRELRDVLLSDPHRPTYHFVNPEGRGMPFDPNGAIFWNGKYHLFYIIQDERSDSWGHASSSDLLHWRFHPLAIEPVPGDSRLGIFSGNCFVNNEGVPTMIYHRVKTGNSIATSMDPNLEVWTKLESNPIIPVPDKDSPEGKLYSSWDPHGWRENGEHYAIFGGPTPALFKAEGLDDWEYVGPFMTHEMPDVDGEHEDLSCPDMFPLGDKHALLAISHEKGARIYLGEWKDNQFRPESHQRMNWPGGTCFAPETILDNKGRRIMWAWVLDRRERLHIRNIEEPPPAGWSGTMTLPRVLSLTEDGTLGIEPVVELEALRMNGRQRHNLIVEEDRTVQLEGFNGNTMELGFTMDPGDAESFGVKVLASPGGEEETLIEFNPSAGEITVDFSKSSLDTSITHHEYTMYFRKDGGENPVVTEQVAPFKLRNGEKVEMRVFLDRSIMEIYVNGRQCITQRVYPTRADSTGIALFSKGGSMTVDEFRAWDMAATNAW